MDEQQQSNPSTTSPETATPVSETNAAVASPGTPNEPTLGAPTVSTPASTILAAVKTTAAVTPKPPVSGAVLQRPSPVPTAAPKPAAAGSSVTAGASRAPSSLASSVNAAVAKKLTIPKGLTKFNTRELTTGFFHGCVYGETSVRKSSTAAQFDTPEKTRIILTRRREQLIPLREMGYEVALVEDADALLFALQYPEQVWPEWANIPDRTLVLDDATEAVAMLLEDASVIDGKEVKDVRRSYREAGDQLREAMKSVLRKPQNFVMICVAKVRSNDITEEERIAPDLPPSMMNFLITELEFVFYIRPDRWKLVTDRDFITYVGQDPTNPNKQKTFRREIFAKNKMPLGIEKVLQKEEDMNLASLWKRIQAAKGKGPVTATLPAKK